MSAAKAYTFVVAPGEITIRRNDNNKLFKWDEREKEYPDFHKWLLAGGTPGWEQIESASVPIVPAADDLAARLQASEVKVSVLETRLAKLEGRIK